MAIFGADHIAAIVATVLAGWFVVRRPPAPSARRLFALLLCFAELSKPVMLMVTYGFSLSRALPLELCDLAAFATIGALWTGSRRWFEFAWFWGLSGAALAILTPALGKGFPAPDYFRFFVAHGAIVCGALALFGGGMRVRRGAARRVFLVTFLYALALMAFDFAVDANYMYLRRAPAGPVLESFGPWPWYLVGATGVAGATFWLLARVARDRAPA